MKDREAELFSLYSQFLGLMANEKAAKESYLKAVVGNMNKVEQMKSKLQRNSKEASTCVIMCALLDTYSKVLAKLEVKLRGEVDYMEENFIRNLDSKLKQNKAIVQNLDISIELMNVYTRNLTEVYECKNAMFMSYPLYEQGPLIDEVIAKVVSIYAEDSPRKIHDISKFTFPKKEIEYMSAVNRFNEEATKLLNENVLSNDSETQVEQGVAVHREDFVHRQGSCGLCHKLPSRGHHDRQPRVQRPDKSCRQALIEELDKIDPLFEISSWVQCNMSDLQKIEKVERNHPRSFFSENIRYQVVNEEMMRAQNSRPE